MTGKLSGVEGRFSILSEPTGVAFELEGGSSADEVVRDGESDDACSGYRDFGSQ